LFLLIYICKIYIHRTPESVWTQVTEMKNQLFCFADSSIFLT